MKKFCCVKFQYLADQRPSMGLNIRIIKVPSQYWEGYVLAGEDNPYSYLITEGYEEINPNMKRLFIEYCPFCGKKLRKLYNSDAYVNEHRDII